MKKLTTSILLALFSATIFTPTHVEASWLSKTWKKVEKSWNEAGKQSTSTGTSGSSTSAIRLPQRSEYPSNFGLHQVVGHSLETVEYQVLGVPMGSTFRQVRNSLGEPTEINHGMRYGGVTFAMSFTKGDYYDTNVVDYIEITNRDATLEQVYNAYGRPTYIFDNNAWFYGAFMWNSDYISGIYFDNDGERVTKVHLHSH